MHVHTMQICAHDRDPKLRQEHSAQCHAGEALFIGALKLAPQKFGVFCLLTGTNLAEFAAEFVTPWGDDAIDICASIQDW